MKAKQFNVTHNVIRSNKIEKSLTVVQISDLHNCCNENRNKMIAAAIEKESPDIIVCTGDLFNRKDSTLFSDSFALIRSVLSIAPVYVIEGNHESALGKKGEDFLNELRKMGACVLMNEAVTVQGIRLIGLREQPECRIIENLASDHLFNLVLSHRPERFSEYAETKADLVLCGHAHGGQIQIGNIPLYAPEQGTFPRYTSGLYEKNHTIMFVSRGMGDTILIPRINNPHELNVIRLIPVE